MSGDAAATAENVALQFAKVALEYKPQKADGSLDTGVFFKYDIKAQKEGVRGYASALTTDRAVSLDEAISIAIRFQQSDQWVAAGEIYRRVLEVSPDYPDAVHYSGVLAHQEGRSEEAVELIERSLELEPRPGGLVQQSGDRPAGSPRAG